MNRLQRKQAWWWVPFFLLLCVYSAEGAFYQWEDGDGTVHLTDDLKKVPQQYRRQVEKKQAYSPAEQAPLAPSHSRPSVESESTSRQTGDIKGKKWWRDLVRKWEKKRKDAEGRLEELEIEIHLIERKMPEKNREKEKTRLSNLMKAARLRRDVAERMLTDGLPDEARRAGVPAEWLAIGQ
jgi:hypothetical protein